MDKEMHAQGKSIIVSLILPKVLRLQIGSVFGLVFAFNLL